MDYKDITSDLCIKCGICCRVEVPVNIQADTRVYEYYTTVGLNISLAEGNNSIAKVDMGYCRHLDTSNGLFKCKIYDNRPQLCRDFNCLAWARCHNIEDKSEALAHATKIFNEMTGGVETK